MASLSDTEINFTAFDLNWDYRHLTNHDEVDVIVIAFEKMRWNVLKTLQNGLLVRFRKRGKESSRGKKHRYKRSGSNFKHW